ncbi:MAG: TIGR03564 family F420-dependent LLM class oxidoreductase [Dehalococcoidia bacterium]
MKIVSTAFGSTLRKKVERLRELEEDGFAGGWVNSGGHEATVVLALAAAETSRIELGTFVLPTYLRHPVAMAQAAMAVQAASGNRFVLGLGLSHRVTIEDMFGLDYSKPVRHMREYLEVLIPLLAGEQVSHDGQEFRVHASLPIADAEPPQVLVAALGPQMLRLTGRLAGGTALWLAGHQYIDEVVVPEMTRAAANAGRPTPRIVAGLPIVVTADPNAARERISQAFGGYYQMPSYERVIDGSGASSPAGVSIVGTEEEVERELIRLRDAGVTDFYAAIEGQDRETRTRTREFLKSLAPEI